MADLARYETLRPQASPREVAGCTIYVASLEDIILSKETTNRAPDYEALPELRALRAAELAAVAYPGSVDDALRRGPDPDSGPAEGTTRDRDYRQEPPGRRSLQ